MNHLLAIESKQTQFLNGKVVHCVTWSLSFPSALAIASLLSISKIVSTQNRLSQSQLVWLSFVRVNVIESGISYSSVIEAMLFAFNRPCFFISYKTVISI